MWRTIPVLEFMLESWENMAKHDRFEDVTYAIEAGLDNLKKWYRKVDDTDAYFICMGMSSVNLIAELNFINGSFGSKPQACVC